MFSKIKSIFESIYSCLIRNDNIERKPPVYNRNLIYKNSNIDINKNKIMKPMDIKKFSAIPTYYGTFSEDN